jgi:hypothetical protein|tara:strand:- start:1439 stop:1615 length:177 start_codon:yes stop_codon:yes gene_type:complete
MKILENEMNNYAQPASSGVEQKITAELLIPDPEKTIAMDLLNESRTNSGADGDHQKSS